MCLVYVTPFRALGKNSTISPGSLQKFQAFLDMYLSCEVRTFPVGAQQAQSAEMVGSVCLEKLRDVDSVVVRLGHLVLVLGQKQVSCKTRKQGHLVSAKATLSRDPHHHVICQS